jgi:hypothetical protein
LPVNLKKSKITAQNTLRTQPKHDQNTTKTQPEHNPNTLPSAIDTYFVKSNYANSIVAMRGSVFEKEKQKQSTMRNDDFDSIAVVDCVEALSQQ